MIEGKIVSPNEAFWRLFRTRCRKNARADHVLETITKARRGVTGSVSRIEEDGSVLIKMVVKKKDLTQVLEAMGGGGSSSRVTFGVMTALSVSVEQRLALRRRKHFLREKLAAATWSPALQSIPEEID